MKPKSCLDCPAVQVTNKEIICGCYKVLKADKKDYKKQSLMNKNCIIDWDKE